MKFWCHDMTIFLIDWKIRIFKLFDSSQCRTIILDHIVFSRNHHFDRLFFTSWPLREIVEDHSTLQYQVTDFISCNLSIEVRCQSSLEVSIHVWEDIISSNFNLQNVGELSLSWFWLMTRFKSNSLVMKSDKMYISICRRIDDMLRFESPDFHIFDDHKNQWKSLYHLQFMIVILLRMTLHQNDMKITIVIGCFNFLSNLSCWSIAVCIVSNANTWKYALSMSLYSYQTLSAQWDKYRNLTLKCYTHDQNITSPRQDDFWIPLNHIWR